MCIGTATSAVGARLLPKQSQRLVDAQAIVGSVQLNRARWGSCGGCAASSVVFWLTASSRVAHWLSSRNRTRSAASSCSDTQVQIGPGHFGALHGLQVLLLLPLLMGSMSWLRRRGAEPRRWRR